MSNENPGDQEENTKGKDVSELPEEEVEGEGGEGLEGEGGVFAGILGSPASLKSDLCEDEEVSGEEMGEAEWVCEEVDEGEAYFGEGMTGSEEYEGETRPELPLEEKRSLDSEYLKAVLGTPLTYALLDIAMKRPTDPIQYLGHYLLRWRWCGDNKEKYENNVKELTEERLAYIERLKEKERQEMLVNEQEIEEERRREKVESSIEDDFGESLRIDD